MKQFTATIDERPGGGWTVAIGTREWIPGRRVPRTLRRPWEHVVHLPRECTVDDVFAAVRVALAALAAVPRGELTGEGPGAP